MNGLNEQKEVVPRGFPWMGEGPLPLRQGGLDQK